MLPPVRNTECSRARDVALSGHIDRRAQVTLRNLLRTDTPKPIRLSAMCASG
jgi:hypothetical protein